MNSTVSGLKFLGSPKGGLSTKTSRKGFGKKASMNVTS